MPVVREFYGKRVSKKVEKVDALDADDEGFRLLIEMAEVSTTIFQLTDLVNMASSAKSLALIFTSKSALSLHFLQMWSFSVKVSTNG